MLVKVTRPASSGDRNSMSVNSTIATPTIAWAIRAICMVRRMRRMDGTANSAR